MKKFLSRSKSRGGCSQKKRTKLYWYAFGIGTPQVIYPRHCFFSYLVTVTLDTHQAQDVSPAPACRTEASP